MRSAPVPKDAAQLPLFKGDKGEEAHSDTFLHALRRDFRIHAWFYRYDPGGVPSLPL